MNPPLTTEARKESKEHVRRFTLASWVSIKGRHCFEDFVKDSDYTRLEAENQVLTEALEEARREASMLVEVARYYAGYDGGSPNRNDGGAYARIKLDYLSALQRPTP